MSVAMTIVSLQLRSQVSLFNFKNSPPTPVDFGLRLKECCVRYCASLTLCLWCQKSFLLPLAQGQYASRASQAAAASSGCWDSLALPQRDSRGATQWQPLQHPGHPHDCYILPLPAALLLLAPAYRVQPCGWQGPAPPAWIQVTNPRQGTQYQVAGACVPCCQPYP